MVCRNLHTVFFESAKGFVKGMTAGNRKVFIGGEWIDTGNTYQLINPYNGKTIANVCMAGEAEIDRAIEAARDAFDITRSQSSLAASTLLKRIAEGVKTRKDELVEKIIAEAGKPRALADVEVERTISTFSIAAEEANRIGGEYLPLDIDARAEDRIGITRRFPIGIIAGISPFNFPLNLVAHKVAPALASKNCIIVKPARQTPLTALILAEIIEEAGCVKGQLSVAPSMPAVGEKLVTDPRIAKLSFTGSPAVGWRLKKLANEKKVTLELGGNAAAVVAEDADLDWAVPRIVAGAFAYAGQVCISVQRILIHESRYGECVEKLVAHTKEKAIYGDPSEPDVMVGPMINKGALDKTVEWVKEAKSQGAKILIGGKSDGPFFEPTIISDVTPDMNVCAEEVFAPVAVVQPYKDFDEAIKMVNDSKFGLQMGIFTNRMDYAFQAFEEAEVGGVIVNDFPTFRVDNMPYGGIKQSGFGREGIKYAIDEMTEIKVMVARRQRHLRGVRGG